MKIISQNLSYRPIASFDLINNQNQALVKDAKFSSNSIKDLNANFRNYYLPFISFKGVECSTSDFEVKNIVNLHCPYCGKLMLNSKQQDEFATAISTTKGQDLVEAIDKYSVESAYNPQSQTPNKTVLRPCEMEVLDIVQSLALENPDLDLKGLIQKASPIYMEILVLKQLEVIDELEKYIKSRKLPPEIKAQTKELIEVEKKYIKNEKPQPFQRKMFLEAFSSIPFTMKTKKNVMNILLKMPSSKDDVSSFIVKYSKPEYTSKSIANAIIDSASHSTEHMQPKSKNGASATQNYMDDCKYCNNGRGDLDFLIWARSNKVFQPRLQKYIEEVENGLDKTDMPEYITYLDEFIGQVKILTDGEIELSGCDKEFESRRKRLAKEFYVIHQRKQQANNIEKRIKAANNYEAQLRSQYKEEFSQIRRYKQEMKRAKNEKAKESLQAEIDEIYSSVKEDKLRYLKAKKRIHSAQANRLKKIEFLEEKEPKTPQEVALLEKLKEESKEYNKTYKKDNLNSQLERYTQEIMALNDVNKTSTLKTKLKVINEINFYNQGIVNSLMEVIPDRFNKYNARYKTISDEEFQRTLSKLKKYT